MSWLYYIYSRNEFSHLIIKKKHSLGQKCAAFTNNMDNLERTIYY